MKTVLGLVLKDYLTLKQYLWRQIGLLVAIYVILGFVLHSMSMLPSMLTLGVMMLLLSTFSLDEQCHWNAYAISLGLSPRTLVRARYLFCYGLLIATALLSTVVSYGMEAFVIVRLTGESADDLMLAGLAGSGAILVVYLLVSAVNFPLFYKLGMEKARLAMSLSFVLPFIVIFPTISYWGPLVASLEETPPPAWASLALLAALAALVVAAALVSMRVSTRILEKKEF